SFFFSRRRRHTRSKRDWSSDVCSSDLVERVDPVALVFDPGDDLSDEAASDPIGFDENEGAFHSGPSKFEWTSVHSLPGRRGGSRSEERRVGKARRSRGGTQEWQARAR